ncbi:MAG: DNA topoisomerase, partial [Bacteroidota bacterium]
LCELKLPDDYKAEWKRWNLAMLPMLPNKFETKLKKDKGVKKQFGIIKKLFKKASVVINCGDAGQEGELIQRWVIKEAGYKGPVQRLWISSLTSEAIRLGFRQLKDGRAFDNLYYAGSSRAVGDWLLGMNATRLYTLKYGSYKQVLSVGRVQTPTLAMVVKRHYEIINFKPSPYWELHTLYRAVDFQYENGRFTKREEGQLLLEKVKGQPFVISEVEQKKGKEYAPRLFDLTSLQVYCNKRFNYTAEQTLKIVQQLYEQKVVTYPRVDTTFLPTDVYPKVKGILGKMKQYQALTQSILQSPIRKSTRVFNDKKVTDHHAIIPTGIEKQLPANLQQVYDAIARRFIATFYPDCVVNKTTVIGIAADVRFKAMGKEILVPGWRVVLARSKSKRSATAQGKEEELILPNFAVGESGTHEPKLLEKMTQPPKHYTEATLLRAMETAGKQVEDDELRDLMKANGIGRPSTRANILETLLRRQYLKRKRKQIHPTETGLQLIKVIDNELLKSPELTGQWEKKLGDIAKGTHRPQQFVIDMKEMLTQLVKEVSERRVAASERVQPTTPTAPVRRSGRTAADSSKQGVSARRAKPQSQPSIIGHSCPKCKRGQLLKGKTAYGCGNYATGCDFRLPFRFMGKKISEKQLLRLLTYGKTIQLKGFKRGKSKVNGQLRFDDSFGVYLKEKGGAVTASTNKSPQETTSATPEPSFECPKCKIGKMLKGKTAYGCSRYREGCDFKVLFEEVRAAAGAHPITRARVAMIIKQCYVTPKS